MKLRQISRDVARNVSTVKNKVHLWLRQASYIKKRYDPNYDKSQTKSAYLG